MFTKDEIKARLSEIRHQANLRGEPEIKAELNLALIIAGSALFTKKLRSGEDYNQHSMEVASRRIQSKTKRIIAVLHDVIEDSDWTLDDLREVGFSKRVVDGVDGITKRKDEKYFDFIVRCGLSGDDSIEVKINDLSHNMDSSRYRHLLASEDARLKDAAYNVSYHYLVDILKTRAEKGTDYNQPGRPFAIYMSYRSGYREDPKTANLLLERFSSRPERIGNGTLLYNFNPKGP